MTGYFPRAWMRANNDHSNVLRVEEVVDNGFDSSVISAVHKRVELDYSRFEAFSTKRLYS